MDPNRIKEALTRLLFVSSYMDKDKPIGLICNLWTLQYLVLSDAKYKYIDYSNYEIEGKHVFICNDLPNFVIGLAYEKTCPSIITILSKVDSSDKKDHFNALSEPGYHFFNPVLYLTAQEKQVGNKSWPSQMAFIENG